MAARTFDDLPGLFDNTAKRMLTAVTNIARRAVLAGGTYVASETPVDTGAARSNWVATVDEAFVGVIPPYVPYPTYRTNHHEAVKQLVLRAPGRVKIFSGSK